MRKCKRKRAYEERVPSWTIVVLTNHKVNHKSGNTVAYARVRERCNHESRVACADAQQRASRSDLTKAWHTQHRESMTENNRYVKCTATMASVLKGDTMILLEQKRTGCSYNYRKLHDMANHRCTTQGNCMNTTNTNAASTQTMVKL